MEKETRREGRALRTHFGSSPRVWLRRCQGPLWRRKLYSVTLPSPSASPPNSYSAFLCSPKFLIRLWPGPEVLEWQDHDFKSKIRGALISGRYCRLSFQTWKTVSSFYSNGNWGDWGRRPPLLLPPILRHHHLLWAKARDSSHHCSPAPIFHTAARLSVREGNQIRSPPG